MRWAGKVAVALAAIAVPLSAEPYVATAPDADRQLAAMVELYDTICLKAFPDDAAVARLMRDRGAAPLDAAGVREKLHDDPGVGWTIDAAGARFTITVEAPPFHACAVRTMTAKGFADLAPYRRVRDAFAPLRGPLQPTRPFDQVVGTIHSKLQGEGRDIGGGQYEMLIVGSGEVVDPAARKAGQTAIEMRFVHQIVAHPAAPARAS